jgi:hypothetical protein
MNNEQIRIVRYCFQTHLTRSLDLEYYTQLIPMLVVSERSAGLCDYFVRSSNR